MTKGVMMKCKVCVLVIGMVAALSGCGEADTAGSSEIPRDYKIKEQKLMSSMDECWTYVQRHTKGGEPELRKEDENVSIFTFTLNSGAEMVQACAKGENNIVYTMAVGEPVQPGKNKTDSVKEKVE